jgi:hypothetical protein
LRITHRLTINGVVVLEERAESEVRRALHGGQVVLARELAGPPKVVQPSKYGIKKRK